MDFEYLTLLLGALALLPACERYLSVAIAQSIWVMLSDAIIIYLGLHLALCKHKKTCVPYYSIKINLASDHKVYIQIASYKCLPKKYYHIM